MVEQMDIVAVTGVKKAEVIQIDKPMPGENQVLVKIHGCGICTFEQRVFGGIAHMKLPFAGGHEIVGRVEELGLGVDAREYPIGHKLVARTMKACGECYYCRHGQPNMCVKKSSKFNSDKIQPAGLGQYIVLDTAQIYLVPEELEDDCAVITEPLACVINSIEKGKIQLGDDVVVLGGGIMGVLHVMCAKLRGARVILSEPDAKRAQKALELGADFVINPIKTDPVAEVKRITGRGANVVFNTIANAQVAQQAVEMTAPLGICVMYTSIHPNGPIQVDPGWIHSNQVTITGAVSPSIESFATAVTMLSKGIIRPGAMVSEKISYQKPMEAFEAALRPDTYRVMMTF